MKTKSSFNPNPAMALAVGAVAPTATPSLMEGALSQFYWQAHHAWANSARWAEMVSTAFTPTGVKRLYGQPPTVFHPEQGWNTLHATKPLAWRETGTMCTVPAGTVLQHKEYRNGFSVVSYYAPGTQFREVSKGSPHDETVWEVLPPV